MEQHMTTWRDATPNQPNEFNFGSSRLPLPSLPAPKTNQ